jgi:hypothetical protein
MADLTEEQAQQMLKDLAEHYGEPVKPVGEYCKAISAWMKCIVENNAKEYAGVLHRIEIDIRKSALLCRLIYCGEKLRTEPCPIHKGHLNMAEWIGFPSEPQCEHLCGGTGWLPQPGDPNAVGSIRLCNKPYQRSRKHYGGPGDPKNDEIEESTEYCRKLPGHSDGECSAWQKI